jgi:hypothetical protein
MGDGILIEGRPGLQPGCHPWHRRLILLFRTEELKIGKGAIHLPAFQYFVKNNFLSSGRGTLICQTKTIKGGFESELDHDY